MDVSLLTARAGRRVYRVGMKLLQAAAATAALLTIPAVAGAQSGDAMHDAMHGAMAGHAMSATMLCRPAASGEHGNAMMGDSHAAMVCKSMPAMSGERKMGPDVSKALTPAQADEAWHRWLDAQLAIPATGGG